MCTWSIRDLYIYNLGKGSWSTPITFTIKDETSSLFKDTLVIILRVGSCDVYLVDTESLVDFIFLTTMWALGVQDGDITIKEMPLLGFNTSTMYIVGIMVLLVMVIDFIIMRTFVVINVSTHYKTILGRPWIHKMKVVPSTYHKVIKYPTNEGVKK